MNLRNLKNLDSKALTKMSEELTSRKSELPADQYRAMQHEIDVALAKKHKEEQNARRDANPEEYDRLHQGVGRK